MYKITDKIRFIKGVGPTKAKELESIKIKTVLDLLETKPLDYIFPGVQKIADLPTEGNVLINGVVEEIGQLLHSRHRIAAHIADETGNCEARWFGSSWLLSNVTVGTHITLWGKVKHRIFHQPKFTTAAYNPEEVTGGQYGVHSVTIRAALKEVLSDAEIPDYVHGVSQAEVFSDFHFPECKEDYQLALGVLKQNECFLMQLALGLRRKQIKQKAACVVFDSFSKQILNYFPHQLTGDQTQVIDEICKDLASGKAMQRLLHGEVGSGKTLCAFYAAMLMALNGKRTFILCPTSILAMQHFETLKSMGWDDVMLCLGADKGSMPPLQHCPIVIGTTALLNLPHLKTVSLVVIDETHKFGTHQRAKLQQHNNPHVLLLSATPIPRTLFMSIFGDLDVSTIKELPIKRGTVVTKWVLPGRREQMYELIIEEQLKQGRQIYIVYPRIDSEDEDLVNATSGYDNISLRFSDYDSRLLTGRYNNAIKSQVLEEFKSGRCKILVSTIIAEVGLDNPNATVMVIEGADRFGLSQLHQLRGRVCRSTDTSFCFLVAETANETSIARLNVMEQTNDGFEIAEHDLRLRGPGEIFSARQHGLPDLKFVNIVDDYELMLSARELAGEYVDKLDEPGNEGLKQMLEIKYGETLKLSGIA